MHLIGYLKEAIEWKASDIFIITGVPCAYRIDGHVIQGSGEVFKPEEVHRLIQEIYHQAKDRSQNRIQLGDDDFSFSVRGLGRFRANVYQQRGTLAAVIRVFSFELPTVEQFNIPECIMDVCNLNYGLVLVSGQAGSGKSTTLACMIDCINRERTGHIVTMEDPIEFIHKHKKCIVSQREIAQDSVSYISALRAVLRQSPDVILLGELRDLATMEIAMTAAETGQLLFSTLHTTGAANTIDRIIDVFPAEQQKQIRNQLAMILQAIISQQLVPSKDGTLLPVFEIMKVTPAIRNMIREGKTHMIESAIFSGSAIGMCTMDQALLKLYKEDQITGEVALKYALHPESLKSKLE